VDTNNPADHQQPGAKQPAAKPTRRRYTVAQKLEMVKATLDECQSVSVVARQHDVNANQLYRWRRQYRDGLLVGDAAARLLPIQVRETVPDTAPADPVVGVHSAPANGTLEVMLPTGHRIRVIGAVCQQNLITVLEALS